MASLSEHGDFRTLTDLAAKRLGGMVLGSSDEFFAGMENLLLPSKPVFIEDRYTDRGKWMDGWESRRKRVAGHDHCIVRLGLPGIVRGVVIDTAFFRGNYPEHASLEGTVAPLGTSYEDLERGDFEWVELLPKVALRGDSENLFRIDGAVRVTHLRLAIYPDGGVARLRVHGDAIADAERLGRGVAVDLASVELGSSVVYATDMFFGSRHNVIYPDSSVDMHDGWETKRRRGPGHDDAIIALGVPGSIDEIVIDTSHFKGNYPDSCELHVANLPDATLETLRMDERIWSPLLARTKLEAHRRHYFAPVGPNEATHVRFRIHPDGGVSRLRLFGRPTPSGRVAAGLRRLAAMLPRERHAAMMTCCGSRAWADAMTNVVLDARATVSVDSLVEAGLRHWASLERAARLEALAAHPRLGSRADVEKKFGAWRRWSTEEQRGASEASAASLDALVAANAEYERRFGYIFVLCATGKSVDEMLASIGERLGNDAEREFDVASSEQAKILALRLQKLVGVASPVVPR